MIVQVALGIVLAYVIIFHWRTLISFAFLGFWGAVAIALLFLIGWGIYLAYGEYLVFKAAHASFFDVVSSVFAFLFAVLFNLALGAGCGEPLKKRTSLNDKQAVAFGIIFWVLFWFTAAFAVTLTTLIEKFNPWIIGMLAVLLIAVWVVAVRQCIARSRLNAISAPTLGGADYLVPESQEIHIDRQ